MSNENANHDAFMDAALDCSLKQTREMQDLLRGALDQWKKRCGTIREQIKERREMAERMTGKGAHLQMLYAQILGEVIGLEFALDALGVEP